MENSDFLNLNDLLNLENYVKKRLQGKNEIVHLNVFDSGVPQSCEHLISEVISVEKKSILFPRVRVVSENNLKQSDWINYKNYKFSETENYSP